MRRNIVICKIVLCLWDLQGIPPYIFVEKKNLIHGEHRQTASLKLEGKYDMKICSRIKATLTR
jgi:hypothetical protein